jgi:kynurenine formamidase
MFDITLDLNENTVIYPGNPGVTSNTISIENCMLSTLSFGVHSGTHIDAPSHFIPGGKSVDELDIDRMIK